MVSLERFLSDLKDALGWPYCSPGSTGKDCSQSGIDCSGMACRAFKMQGNNSLYHGCNTMWRDGCFSDKGKLSSVSQLHPGYTVLLNRAWRDGDSSNKWYGDSEGNFTHIGYVLSVNPLRIIDASASAGKVRETESIKKVGWTHWARFKAIDYGTTYTDTNPTSIPTSQEANTMTMTVKTSNGKGANIRARRSTTSTQLGTVADGDTVDVIKDCGDGWVMIDYNGQQAYCLAKLLTSGDSTLTLEERVLRIEKKLGIA